MTGNAANLYYKSKTVSLIILAITAVIFSRMLFVFFNDLEGPNPIIIAAVTVPVYLLSLTVYLFTPVKITGIGRLLVVIGIQILLVAGVYFFMR